MESGFCPNGHRLTDCHKLSWSAKRQKFEHRCSYVLRARQRSGYMGGAEWQRNRKNFFLTTPGKVDNHENNSPMAHLILVCGHDTYYTRRSIEVNDITYPGDLWCDRCVEWKMVHFASNMYVDKPGWIYYPLEVEK